MLGGMGNAPHGATSMLCCMLNTERKDECGVGCATAAGIWVVVPQPAWHAGDGRGRRTPVCNRPSQ